ncbi:DUF5667 domain-containing protein [Planomonospora parontospora]|uniref:DUF5667 domain-containing protein n=1 Tax=Planomonospora parontospora TaxID=58119 RepID=UPI001671289D|nr:DUF5667 domain-containing protein [Planomonospora parontospora]GGL36387.1 hypothetical protein GCM10014719_41880 [Planomonospora parontospora subsp. antibiotica]GII17375.1 hypothetical protein Ppa05_41010 [Planomonospora parontospora subsp. antibiotica]
MGKWLPGISRRSRARARHRVSGLGARMEGASPRPEFRAELRDRLVHASPGRDPLPEPVPVQRTRRAPRVRLLPQLLSAALAVGMVTTGLTTYGSVPGDTLYPLKRAAENTLLRLSSDDAERADRGLQSASTRADEVEALLGSTARGEGNLVGQTLQAMEDTTRSAVTSLTRVRRRDAEDAEEATGDLERFVRKQRDQIEGMLPKMDEEDQRRANGYLNYIEGLAPPG